MALTLAGLVVSSALSTCGGGGGTNSPRANGVGGNTHAALRHRVDMRPINLAVVDFKNAALDTLLVKELLQRNECLDAAPLGERPRRRCLERASVRRAMRELDHSTGVLTSRLLAAIRRADRRCADRLRVLGGRVVFARRLVRAFPGTWPPPGFYPAQSLPSADEVWRSVDSAYKAAQQACRG